MSKILKPGEHPMEDRVATLEKFANEITPLLKLLEGLIVLVNNYFAKAMQAPKKEEEKK